MTRCRGITVGLVGVGLLALGGCDSGDPADAGVASSPTLSSAAGHGGGQSFWTGTIDGGGSWKFGAQHGRTTALSIHRSGTNWWSRDCPADLICGGIWGGSGDTFIDITVMEEYVGGEPMRFVFCVAWGNSETFEAVIFDDFQEWWSFMDAQAGVSTPIVVQNIRDFIAARGDVIRGTTRQVLP